MVRYLDDEHLLVDTSNFVHVRNLVVYKDSETDERFFLCHINGNQDLSKYLPEFGRLLRAKNFPQFVGLAGSRSVINVVLDYTPSFVEDDASRYLRSLFVANFPVTVMQTQSDHINGIMFMNKLRPGRSNIILSPLEKEEFFATIAQLQGANFDSMAVRFDLQPLWNHFTDDDWEQLCFGLYYLSDKIMFFGPNTDEITMNNLERHKVDKNLAHYGVKPQYLSVVLSAIDPVIEGDPLIRLEEIFSWLRRFTLETLFHNEQRILEVEMDEPENLVNLVINNLREETALRRKRI